MLDIEMYLVGETNNLYVNRYIKFINNIYNKGKRNLDYTERHHIIPKCVNKSLYKDRNNIIILTAKEHYIAHLILSKCYKPGTDYYNRLICALFAMSKLKMNYHRRQDIKLTGTKYEQIREKYGESRREIMRQNVKDPKYKKFIGKGESSSNKGMIFINNGNINAYLKRGEKIPEGWRKGALQINKHPEKWKQHLKESWEANRENRVGKNHPMYGKGYLLEGEKNGRYGIKLKYINNGVKNKMVPPNEVQNYLNSGWKLGQLRYNK